MPMPFQSEAVMAEAKRMKSAAAAAATAAATADGAVKTAPTSPLNITEDGMWLSG